MGLLQPVFANPEICKMFHGADTDVLWLQRDFHIYVVNLFDNGKKCDMLSKPQRSLAYLLETYCGVATNKLLQREDWRQRPLPEEMIQYARTDAHYLLYIARCLCSELKLQKNENSSPGDEFHFLLEAIRRSNATCLQLFAKDIEVCSGELAASSMVTRCLNDQGDILSSHSDSKFQELVRRLCLWMDIMIVIKYYGGREISDEDLERALLVGMSPHERKKYEKKKGFAFKHLTGCINLNEEKEHTIGYKETLSIHNASKGENVDSLCTNTSETDQNQYDVDILMVEEDMTVSTQPSCLKDLDDRGAAVADSNDMPHIKSDSKYADFSGTGNLSGETINPVHATDIPLKHESKLSLLGHGPHGKQVVENLLKDYGEDGVLEFCQRWRQVFVEALHPRFLPAGWDIMHMI